jgi:hypothetical protein
MKNVIYSFVDVMGFICYTSNPDHDGSNLDDVCYQSKTLDQSVWVGENALGFQDAMNIILDQNL